MRFLDPPDGTTGGSSPSSVAKNYIDINWLWPATTPNPAYFEVVAFTGTDPTASTNYLFAPMRVPGSDRRLVTTITPLSTYSNVNAAVRPIYA